MTRTDRRPRKVSQLPAASSVHHNPHPRPPREVLVDIATELRERSVMTVGLADLSVDRYRDGTVTEDGDIILDHATFEALLQALRDAAVRVRDLARALHEAADEGRFHPEVKDEKKKEGK